MLNIAGLAYATYSGEWKLRQMYDTAYFPIVITVWILGALGYLPRVKASTQGEGHERRFFYGSVWAVCIAQPVLWALWKALPHTAGRRPQARRLRGHPGLGRPPLAPRAAAAHAARSCRAR